MENDYGLRLAQIQRDNYVPEKPPGKGDWCPVCGNWKQPGPCEHCRQRAEIRQKIELQKERFLRECWFAGSQRPLHELEKEYLAHEMRCRQEGSRLGLLAMEQVEREFAAALESEGVS